MRKRVKPVEWRIPGGDDCEQDDLLDVSAVGISGRYIELAEQGKLDELLRLQEKRIHLLDNLTIIESELSQFENPVWLLNFYVKAQNRAKNFGTELPRRAGQLERQRTKLRTEIEEIEKQIARIEPLILKAPLHEIPVVQRPPAIKSGENPFVLVRDYAIKLAASEGLSDLDICKRLDLTLTVRGAEAPVGMPEQWVETFGESWKKSYGRVTYVAAYQTPETKNRMQKMISIAKDRLRNG
jgi:hypothetical protein